MLLLSLYQMTPKRIILVTYISFLILFVFGNWNLSFWQDEMITKLPYIKSWWNDNIKNESLNQWIKKMERKLSSFYSVVIYSKPIFSCTFLSAEKIFLSCFLIISSCGFPTLFKRNEYQPLILPVLEKLLRKKEKVGGSKGRNVSSCAMHHQVQKLFSKTTRELLGEF